MAVFRRTRKASGDAGGAAPEPSTGAAKATQGKGRPTPTRRVATGKRAGPVPPPPRTRREAYRRMRQVGGSRRAQVGDRIRAGDDRYLPARDQGPAKALVRDIVDSRRNAGGVFLLVAAVVILSYAVPSAGVRSFTLSLWVAAFLVIIVDSFVLGRRIRKVLTERLPEDHTRGVVWYGVQRATMVRRWRLPKPRVKPGDRV
ncbi:MAG: DUF3043 domain-containing protein [Mycobacteriales bacterium]|nr:MAG: DUF3043 domain-containing protein [Pseudonocardiales bacterium]